MSQCCSIAKTREGFQFPQEAHTSLLNHPPETLKWKRKRKNFIIFTFYILSLPPSSQGNLVQMHLFYPRSFHASYLLHILMVLPHFFLCSSPAFPQLYCSPACLLTPIPIFAIPNLNQCLGPKSSSSYSLLLLSWYLLPLTLSVLGVVPIILQSLPFCALKILR